MTPLTGRTEGKSDDGRSNTGKISKRRTMGIGLGICEERVMREVLGLAES